MSVLIEKETIEVIFVLFFLHNGWHWHLQIYNWCFGNLIRYFAANTPVTVLNWLAGISHTLQVLVISLSTILIICAVRSRHNVILGLNRHDSWIICLADDCLFLGLRNPIVLQSGRQGRVAICIRIWVVRILDDLLLVIPHYSLLLVDHELGLHLAKQSRMLIQLLHDFIP